MSCWKSDSNYSMVSHGQNMQLLSHTTYMTVRNPSRTLASLEPLNELRPIRDCMGDGILRCSWSARALWDRPFAKFSPNAFLRESATEPASHLWLGLNRNRGRIRILRGRVPEPRTILFTFTKNGHLEAKWAPSRAAESNNGPAGAVWYLFLVAVWQ